MPGRSEKKVFKTFVLTYCIRLSYYYQNAARKVTLPLRNRSSSHDLGVKNIKIRRSYELIFLSITYVCVQVHKCSFHYKMKANNLNMTLEILFKSDVDIKYVSCFIFNHIIVFYKRN